jgi:hypothetical protein
MRTYNTLGPQLYVIQCERDVISGKRIYIAPYLVAGMLAALEFLFDNG